MAVPVAARQVGKGAPVLSAPAPGHPKSARAQLWRTPLPWLGGLLAIYLGGPVLVFLARSAGDPGAGFSAPGLSGALATSALAATISTALVGLAGVPLAYWLARRSGPLANLVGLAVQLPLALPPLVSGVVLLYVFGPYTFLGRLSGGRFTESLAGIVLAQSFVASPYLVVAARSAFRSVDPHLEDVAATAGLKALARFTRVALPLAGPGTRAGLVLTWLRAFGEYGATVMLAYHPYSLPVFIYVQFSAVGLPATQAPALLALAVATFVVGLSRLTLPRPARGRQSLRLAEAPPPLPARSVATERPKVAVAFDLSVHKGPFWLQMRHRAASHRLAIVGPSGAGKSLTLRALAGLEKGSVSFAGKPVGHLPPEKRRAGYLPQGDSLLPHLPAWANATLGPNADPAAASSWMAALGVSELERRLPAEMSGGQRRRVGLARALSCRADVVLLDEPFAGLDAPQRADLLRTLRRLQLREGFSSVLVTHDFTEAALLADELVVVSKGKVLQAGRLASVFDRPATAEVARVLGFANVFAGVATGPASLSCGPLSVATAPHGAAAGEPVTWCVRPEQIAVAPAAGGSSRPAMSERALRALVVDVAELPGRAWATLRLAGGTELQAELCKPPFPTPGTACWADIPPESVLVWPGRAEGAELTLAGGPEAQAPRNGRGRSALRAARQLLPGGAGGRGV